MEVVGVVAAVPGLIQIIQAVITAVRGVSKKDVAPKVAQNLIQSLQNVEQILERGKEQGLWTKPQFEQHKSTIKQWTTELVSLKLVLQPSNIKKETRRSLKKFYLVLTELEKTLNEWSTRLSHIQTELVLIMTHIQQEIMKDVLHETVTSRLRADLHPCSDSFIPDKSPGTCEWIWSQTTLSDWVKSSPTMPDSYLKRTLCIHGMKGCGKSVLIKSIAQKLGDQGQIALHFSFWSGDENQRKLQDLLRTLVWQTLRRIKDADLEKVSKLLTRSDGIDKRSLVEALRIALSGISQKVYCTIDGIDESSEDWNCSTDGCLSTVLDLVKDHTNLHVLLAGREASLRTFLKRAGPRLEITEHLIRGDIEKLIAAEIHDSLKSYSQAIRDEAQKSLEAKTQVMFLWVTLVLKELRRCSSVEDVRQTLQQVPHDLDREYHRLLLQLMIRTKGSLAKPSISMKRARCVLSSILACPEPMTGEDLCYAYATQANMNGTIEDDLITIDGIMDACGDFVRLTEGRYHTIHASATDFLIRPKNEWESEDANISYFQVDLAEAQESMSLACFKYIKSIDLGYPLTDGGAPSLPSKYIFFPYVARYLPFHLAAALQESEQVRIETSKFVKTHHFCALIEFLLATSENSLPNDFLGSMYYWGEIFARMWMELDQAFHLELDRRERDFGDQDERYQSWLALAFLIPESAQKVPEQQARPLKRFARHRSVFAEMKGNGISFLPRHIGNTHGPIIQRVSGSLQALSQIFATFRSTGTDLLAASAESMPVPMLLLAGRVARQQGNPLLAEKIAIISVKKTNGKGGIFELCSLLLLVAVRFYSNQDTSEVTVEMVRKSVLIADRLPTLPHIQMLKVEALQILILILLQHERKVEADEFIRMYEDLIGRYRKESSSRVWEYGLCHTRIGTASRTDALEYMARKLLYTGNYTVSADFSAQAVGILADSGSKPTSKDLSLLAINRDSLYKAGKLDECISSCQQLLDHSTKLSSEPIATDARWQTQILVARCLAMAVDTAEADMWFRKATDEIALLGPDQRHQKRQSWFLFMMEDVALMGQYRLAQSMARELLEIKRVPPSDDEEDLGFGPLESLVSKLKDINSIDPSYLEFLRCHSLLITAQGVRDMAGRVDWFGRRLCSIYDDLESFSKRLPLLKLKYIDTCLRLDDGLFNAIGGYIMLGRFFFNQGNTEAADIVSSDAASRIFSDMSSDDPSWTFRLASQVYLFAGKFAKCIPLLCQAYEESLNVNGDAVFSFEMEMVYAFTYILGLEEFEEDLEKVDLRLSFLEKSCEHVAKASRARDEIDRSKGSGSQEEPRDGDHDAEESRKERMADLKARLEDLNVGSMLTEAVARLGSVAPGAEVLSENNS
ncbi:uncharacterized protein LW94_11131 [Fusarium fujikuroi]|nr:uncharacterized protein LW94_11131 [Fusarium fujikuroi]